MASTNLWRYKMKYLLLLLLGGGLTQSLTAQNSQAIDKAAHSIIKVPGYPDFFATEGDDCWVLNEGRVEKYGARNGTKMMTVPVPGACGAMAVGEGVLWVASCGERSIYKIDTRTGKLLAKILCGISDPQGEIMLALGDGFLWVPSDSSGILTKIDTRSNKTIATIRVSPGSHCATFSNHTVWITSTTGNSVQRIDPRTNEASAPIAVGPVPRFVAADEAGVWTLNQGDGTVTHMDPRTGDVVATIDAKVPGGGGDIAVGGGKVWVRATKGFFLQSIDVRSGKVDKVFTPLNGSGAVRVSTHHIWVSAHDVNTIWVLDR
jgi:virginiamycin B lyase